MTNTRLLPQLPRLTDKKIKITPDDGDDCGEDGDERGDDGGLWRLD